MTDRTSRRTRRVAAVPAAMLTVLALAGPASGSADTGTFHIDQPFSDTLTDFPCFEGTAGTISGTETIDGHFTETGPPSLGFHADGSETQSYRVDLADGRYVLGTFTARFSFNATVRGHIVDSQGGWDRAIAYAADGRPIGPLTIQSVGHVSYVDANGNGEPDPGEFTASVDHINADCP
jgi:hypothetical protein